MQNNDGGSRRRVRVSDMRGERAVATTYGESIVYWIILAWAFISLGHCPCGVADYVEHDFGMGEHGDMAGGHLHRLSTHALRGEAFQIRMDGAILGGHDAPTRL